MNSILNCSAEQLRRAAEIKEQIDKLQRELDGLLEFPGARFERRGAKPGRRFSAATIAKMRASQRARWASRRETLGVTARTKRPRRHMSAAAKARLSEVAKARWKKAHAAGRNSL